MGQSVNHMDRQKLFPSLLMSLLLLVAASPHVEAATSTDDAADCSGDPCAAVKCSVGEASAHAVGSEKAWADATVGSWTTSASGPGSAHAEASGTGDVSASAKGKRDWSLKESNASCSGESVDNEAFDKIVMDPICVCYDIPWGGVIDDDLLSDLIWVDSSQAAFICLADDTITRDLSFQGLLYADDARAVLYDSATGLGIPADELLSGGDLTLGGATLEELGPVDVTGMSFAGHGIGLGLTAAEDGSTGCHVSFF